uniref:Uncharacterized protein n=1 Tax=Rhizophora mucronata TaxID=61149 RepID=A0A2P2PP83_RHIMU
MTEAKSRLQFHIRLHLETTNYYGNRLIPWTLSLCRRFSSRS